MRIINSPPQLFAGIDNLSLDKRDFNPAREDIERICRFFSIGKLLRFKKEKDIIVSHSNSFVFVATSKGQYAIKFYPKDASPTVTTEYAINRILIHHHFLTPQMYPGVHGLPFVASNDRLATCYSYINGAPAWQYIKDRKTMYQINTAMLNLKDILSSTMGRLVFHKQKSFSRMIDFLARSSRSIGTDDQKQILDASLKDICRIYKHHRVLFTRQWLHSDVNLNNFLVYKKSLYTLDLAHIREDYMLSDLASMVISCLFFDMPCKTISSIGKDYFYQHKIGPSHTPALNALVKIKLIREYLKNSKREKSVELNLAPQDLQRSYRSHLKARKESITALLRKMNDTPEVIV